jgi:hypothetical protein
MFNMVFKAGPGDQADRRRAHAETQDKVKGYKNLSLACRLQLFSSGPLGFYLAAESFISHSPQICESASASLSLLMRPNP